MGLPWYRYWHHMVPTACFSVIKPALTKPTSITVVVLLLDQCSGHTCIQLRRFYVNTSKILRKRLRRLLHPGYQLHSKEKESNPDQLNKQIPDHMSSLFMTSKSSDFPLSCLSGIVFIISTDRSFQSRFVEFMLL